MTTGEAWKRGTLKLISCKMCETEIIRTGRFHKYCQECRKKVTIEIVNRCAIKTCKVKNLGVGSGNGQGKGVDHCQYKNGSGIFRRYKKDACEKCDSRKFLCVHHLDENRMNNAPSNLQTVCKSCHQKIHKAYKNFTKNKAA